MYLQKHVQVPRETITPYSQDKLPTEAVEVLAEAALNGSKLEFY